MSKKERLFFGSGTAIITPFKDGGVDYIALGNLIERQLLNSTDAIIVLGTTGEAPTIYEKERCEIITFAKKVINGSCPLIVGTGSNATSVAIRYTKNAQDLGADGCLVVSPYYNKASAKGLMLHYRAIAECVKIPIIMYNVPSRTGMNIPMEVYEDLKSVDNITGVKEAGGSLSYTTELISKYKDFFHIYTGCDELTLSTLALGGCGVISVVSNLLPSHMHRLCAEFSQGNVLKAQELQLYLSPLIKEMFSEVNPIPVKTALAKMGLCTDELRLPLCQSQRSKEIARVLKDYGLL